MLQHIEESDCTKSLLFERNPRPGLQLAAACCEIQDLLDPGLPELQQPWGSGGCGSCGHRLCAEGGEPWAPPLYNLLRAPGLTWGLWHNTGLLVTKRKKTFFLSPAEMKLSIVGVVLEAPCLPQRWWHCSCSSPDASSGSKPGQLRKAHPAVPQPWAEGPDPVSDCVTALCWPLVQRATSPGLWHRMKLPSPWCHSAGASLMQHAFFFFFSSQSATSTTEIFLAL